MAAFAGAASSAILDPISRGHVAPEAAAASRSSLASGLDVSDRILGRQPLAPSDASFYRSGQPIGS